MLTLYGYHRRFFDVAVESRAIFFSLRAGLVRAASSVGKSCFSGSVRAATARYSRI